MKYINVKTDLEKWASFCLKKEKKKVHQLMARRLLWAQPFAVLLSLINGIAEAKITSMIEAFVVTNIIFLILTIKTTPSKIKKNLQKKGEKSIPLHEEKELLLLEDGVQITKPNQTTLFSWDAAISIIEYEKDFHIYVDLFLEAILPARAFESTDDLERFREKLIQKGIQIKKESFPTNQK